MRIILYKYKIFKTFFLKIGGHLRCRLTKNSPRRTKSTPAGVFCTLLASAPPIFKKANSERLFRTDKDVGGSIQKRVCLQTRSPRMYTDVHSWARHLRRCCAQINPQRIIDTPAVNLCSRLVSILSICKKANGKRLFRTDKDVGGSIQKRVCLQTRSPRMYRTYILGRGCPWFYTVSSFS